MILQKPGAKGQSTQKFSGFQRVKKLQILVVYFYSYNLSFDVNIDRIVNQTTTQSASTQELLMLLFWGDWSLSQIASLARSGVRDKSLTCRSGCQLCESIFSMLTERTKQICCYQRQVISSHIFTKYFHYCHVIQQSACISVSQTNHTRRSVHHIVL